MKLSIKSSSSRAYQRPSTQTHNAHQTETRRSTHRAHIRYDSHFGFDKNLMKDILLLLNIASLLITGLHIGCRCHLFQSNPDNLTRGTFKSPNYQAYTRSKYNCLIFTFVGDIEEVVELNFREANLDERKPREKCQDYVRIYQGLDRAELSLEDRPEFELCGRLSSWSQRIFQSTNRVMILETRLMSSATEKDYGFIGEYSFRKKNSKPAISAPNSPSKAHQQCKEDFERADYTTHSFSSGRKSQTTSPCIYSFKSSDLSERVHLKIIIKAHHHGNTSSITCEEYDSIDFVVVNASTITLNNSIFLEQLNHPCILLMSSQNYLSLEHYASHFDATYQFVKQDDSDLTQTNLEQQVSLQSLNEVKLIQTENYPDKYRLSKDQTFLITRPKAGYLQLKITDLNIGFIANTTSVYCKNEYHDKIEIYNEHWLFFVLCQSSDERLITWSDFKSSNWHFDKDLKTLVTQGEKIRVKLVSDYYRNGYEKGFRIELKNVEGDPAGSNMENLNDSEMDDECVHRIQLGQERPDSGINKTPPIEKIDSKNNSFRKKCRWEIYGRPGYRIKMNILPRKTETTPYNSPRSREPGPPTGSSVQHDQEARLSLPQKTLSCPEDRSLKIYNYERSKESQKEIRSPEVITICESGLSSSREALYKSVLSSSVPRLDIEALASPTDLPRLSDESSLSFEESFGYLFNISLVADFGVRTVTGHQRGDNCVFDFYSEESSYGYFSSPNSPGDYPNNVNCLYRLNGQKNQQIHLFFNYFDVEHSKPSCFDEDGDFVEIRSCGSPGVLLNPRLCQIQTDERQLKFISKTPCIKILFRTNEKYSRKGFHISYKFHPELDNGFRQISLLTRAHLITCLLCFILVNCL